MNIQSEYLWIESVIGSKRISNWFWAFILLIAGSGFIIVGLSSYTGQNLLPFISSHDIEFTPQGLIMCFYGIGALFLSTYLCCAILLGIGNGYNEFDRKQGVISIFRWGFPGKNRRIRIRCSIQDIQSIRLKMKEGIASNYTMSLRLIDQQDFPLTQANENLSWEQTEEKAAQLAQFLRVPIEGL